jgi:hypothetical protein
MKTMHSTHLKHANEQHAKAREVYKPMRQDIVTGVAVTTLLENTIQPFGNTCMYNTDRKNPGNWK